MKETRSLSEFRRLSEFTRLYTICMLDNSACFLSYADLFQNIVFFEKLFQEYIYIYIIRVSNSLDPDQVRRFVGPDLCPNCLQNFSADCIRKQIV